MAVSQPLAGREGRLRLLRRRNLLLLLPGIPLLFLAGEAMVRFLGTSPREPLSRLCRFHPRLGWDLKPAGEARFRSKGEYDVLVRTNGRGMRGPLPSSGKSGGEVRILALGDGETLGVSVEEKQAYPFLLAAALGRKGLRASALNGGVEGYSTDQEYLWFLSKGAFLRAELVLLAFRAEDAFWVTRRDYYGIPKPIVDFLPGAEGPRLLPRFSGRPPAWKKPFWRRSLLLNLLAAPGDPLLRAGEKNVPGPLAAFLFRPPAEILQGWKRVEALLAGLKRAVEKKGGLLLVFPIPHRSQVRGEETHALLDRFGFTLKEWNVDGPTSRFLEAARLAGVEAVDPLGFFRQAAASGKVLFYPRSGRLTPEGHLLLARVLEWKLLELGWRGLGK